MKTIQCLALILVLIIPSVSALTLDTKDLYQPQETLIAEINGIILEPINKDQVALRRGHVGVPWEYDLQKLGDSYFLYGLIPSNSNNYTIVISDIVTTAEGKTQQVILEKNISVEGTVIPYNVKPGLINTGDDFTLTITLHEDEEKSIEVSHPSSSLALSPGENKISFDISLFAYGLNDLKIGDYIIPVYNFKTVDNEPLEYIPEIFPEIIISTVLIGDRGPFPFKVINRGDSVLKITSFDYNTAFYTVSPPNANIIPNSSQEFNITLQLTNESIYDRIILNLEEGSLQLPVRINYTADEKEVESYVQNYTTTPRFFCTELKGKFCASNEQCSTALVNSTDGLCCTGACSVPAKKSYAWVGYTIGLVLLIVIVIIGGRYFKSRKKGDPLKNRVQNIERRLKP